MNLSLGRFDSLSALIAHLILLSLPLRTSPIVDFLFLSSSAGTD